MSEPADMEHALEQVLASLAKANQRIADLEGIAAGLEDVTIRKDKRIAELEVQLRDGLHHVKTLSADIQAMAALLDRVPHCIDHEGGGDCTPGCEPCYGDCPACAWARLKACE